MSLGRAKETLSNEQTSLMRMPGSVNVGREKETECLYCDKSCHIPAFAGSEADAALFKCCHWEERKNPVCPLWIRGSEWDGARLQAGLLQKRLEAGGKQCGDERTFSHQSRGQVIMMEESKSATSHL